MSRVPRWALITIAVLAAAVIVLIAALVTRDPTDGATDNQPTTIAGTAIPAATASPIAEPTTGEEPTTQPVPTATAEPATPSASTNALGALLIAFTQAWQSADWEAMRPLANDAVIATAMDSFIEGGTLDVAANITFILQGCSDPTAPTGGCDVLYAPPEGFALIFLVSYITTDDGLQVNELTFTGDAG